MLRLEDAALWLMVLLMLVPLLAQMVHLVRPFFIISVYSYSGSSDLGFCLILCASVFGCCGAW